MNYPIKTLSQLPLILKGFRKERGLTQSAMAEKLGITQQSYAYFEANPATATLDRLFMVLRILGIEISLEQVASATNMSRPPSEAESKNIAISETTNQQTGKTAGAGTTQKKKSPNILKPSRIISIKKKKESW